MTKQHVQLLRDAADDCQAEANNLLNQAPNMGPTKERSYRRQADECMQRAEELRIWANELEQAEPRGDDVIQRDSIVPLHLHGSGVYEMVPDTDSVAHLMADAQMALSILGRRANELEKKLAATPEPTGVDSMARLAVKLNTSSEWGEDDPDFWAALDQLGKLAREHLNRSVTTGD